MKKLKMFCCLLFVIYSCSTKKNIYGEYRYKGISNGFPKEFNLLIREDSFSMSYKSQDASPKCVGKWRISKDTLYLECDTVDSTTDMLSNGYMNQRDYKIKIIKKNKLKIIGEDIILIKK